MQRIVDTELERDLLDGIAAVDRAQSEVGLPWSTPLTEVGAARPCWTRVDGVYALLGRDVVFLPSATGPDVPLRRPWVLVLGVVGLVALAASPCLLGTAPLRHLGFAAIVLGVACIGGVAVIVRRGKPARPATPAEQGHLRAGVYLFERGLVDLSKSGTCHWLTRAEIDRFEFRPPPGFARDAKHVTWDTWLYTPDDGFRIRVGDDLTALLERWRTTGSPLLA